MEEYSVLKQIGKGSYGEVWLSRSQKNNKKYVIKKMCLKNASKKENKAAQLEVQLLASLQHPNIVSYKDSFMSPDSFMYIVMGFCEGGDLHQVIRNRKGLPIDEDRVIDWFIQISMGLQYIHERNILHRDLKTQNIFLTRSKVIKLGDFGIARVLGDTSDMATTMVGTPCYMSPELFTYKPYNHKSDVWALGCCLYEMTTLNVAFNARDMSALMYKVLKGKPPPMPKNYNSEFTKLMKAMLNYNPKNRPSVSAILNHPYIRKKIALLLDETKECLSKPSKNQNEIPQKSAMDILNLKARIKRVLQNNGDKIPENGKSKDVKVAAKKAESFSSPVPQRINGSGNDVDGKSDSNSNAPLDDASSVSKGKDQSDDLPKESSQDPSSNLVPKGNETAVNAARIRRRQNKVVQVNKCESIPENGDNGISHNAPLNEIKKKDVPARNGSRKIPMTYVAKPRPLPVLPPMISFESSPNKNDCCSREDGGKSVHLDGNGDQPLKKSHSQDADEMLESDKVEDGSSIAKQCNKSARQRRREKNMQDDKVSRPKSAPAIIYPITSYVPPKTADNQDGNSDPTVNKIEEMIDLIDVLDHTLHQPMTKEANGEDVKETNSDDDDEDEEHKERREILKESASALRRQCLDYLGSETLEKALGLFKVYANDKYIEEPMLKLLGKVRYEHIHYPLWLLRFYENFLLKFK